MGIFSNMFNKNQAPDTKVPFRIMESEADLQAAIENSKKGPVAIFKHSTRCGISSMALDGLVSDWDFDEKDIEIWYLDLLNYRSVSNAIAHETGVPHQSPQLILLQNAEAVYNASHSSISVKKLHEYV